MDNRVRRAVRAKANGIGQHGGCRCCQDPLRFYRRMFSRMLRQRLKQFDRRDREQD